MPVKGTKTIDAIPEDTTISDYVSGAAVAPGAGELSIYADLAAADQHREMEVYEAIRELMDYAREDNYGRAASADIFYLYTLSTHQITSSLLNTAIVEGMVAIGMDGAVRGGDLDSNIFDSEWTAILNYMKDNGRLTV